MREVFGARLIEKIQPHPVRTCMDLRGQSAKARANREKALLSHVFSKAREWCYTDRANPCQGVKGFTERGRDRYVSDAEFLAVREQAHPTVQDAMDLALLTGQRPADVLKIRRADLRDGVLFIEQNKTRAKRAIELTHLVQAGVDLPTVKRISGHKTLAMVERYSHQNGAHIQAAMDKLQARFKLAS